MQGLIHNFSRPRLAVYLIAVSSVSLLIIHWSDLSSPVSLPRYYVGLVGCGPFSVFGVLIGTIVSLRVPAHQQVAANTYIQFMGQCGRGLGPIVATFFYEYCTGVWGKPSGLSVLALYQGLFGAIAMAIPLTRFTMIFGSWNDLSDAAKAQQQKGAML